MIANTARYSWSAFLPNPPAFGRQPFGFKILPIGEQGNDDIYDMNTQSGSQVSAFMLYERMNLTRELIQLRQWDGFRHVAMQHNGKYVFYNNVSSSTSTQRFH